MSGLNLLNIFRKKVKPVPPPIIEPKYEIPEWMVVAFNMIGTTEIPGPESNSKIDEFLKVVGMPSDDDIAWCSAFACWDLEEVGLRSTRKPNAQSFLHDKNFIKLDKPIFGCIVVFKRGTEPWMGHVGFFIDLFKGWIRLLGGNQSNRVGVNNYSKDDVLGYFWPKAVPLPIIA